jgi:homogentisate 1,2-dioxygenase
MNLFYKIHLQAFNVISIVLYHSGPTFGQVFYSCLNAFVVDVSDYSDHLIRHILNASEAFPTEWFLRNKSKSGGLSPPDFDLFSKLKKPHIEYL